MKLGAPTHRVFLRLYRRIVEFRAPHLAVVRYFCVARITDTPKFLIPREIAFTWLCQLILSFAVTLKAHVTVPGDNIATQGAAAIHADRFVAGASIFRLFTLRTMRR